MITNAFKDISRKSLPQSEGLNGLDYLDRVAAMQVGHGSKVLRVDSSGIWLGAERFADANFSVDMQGRMVFTSEDGKTLTISAVNNRILVADANDNRVLLGFGSGLF